MIITRTPLRISFVGGGTDLPSFYSKEPGAVVSSAINKYVYIFAHPFFSDQIQIKYSLTELVDKVSEIKMPVFREALKLYGIENKIELGIVADLPKEGGSGLGGSTAFSVGLLNALSIYSGRSKSKLEFAAEATNLELNILNNPIGKQDQYASALGGINYIQFNPDDSVVVEPIFLDPGIKAKLKKNLLMFYTGITRNANNILVDQQKNVTSDKEKFMIMRQMRDSAAFLRDQLKKNEIGNFGQILHENWLLKKEMSTGISNPVIDEWYNKALAAGAEGGKILGAGGGGFFLFYCEEERQDELRRKLSGLMEYHFEFEPDGTTVILVDNNN